MKARRYLWNDSLILSMQPSDEDRAHVAVVVQGREVCPEGGGCFVGGEEEGDGNGEGCYLY